MNDEDEDKPGLKPLPQLSHVVQQSVTLLHVSPKTENEIFDTNLIDTTVQIITPMTAKTAQTTLVETVAETPAAAVTPPTNRFPVPLQSTSQPLSQESFFIDDWQSELFTTFDDQKSEFEADLGELYEKEKRCHKLNDWSLKSLRKKFALKNTEIHFTRYQRRLAARLFTVLLILNILTGTIDTATYLYFKSVPVFSLFTALRLISLGVNISFLVGCLRAEHRILKSSNNINSAQSSSHRRRAHYSTSIRSKRTVTQSALTTSSFSSTSLSSNKWNNSNRIPIWNTSLHQRLSRHWPSMGLCATFVFLSMILAEFGVPLLHSLLTTVANWNQDKSFNSVSLTSYPTGAASQPLLRLRPVFYLIICAQLLLPFQRRRRSSLVCICSIVFLELFCLYTLQHERRLLLTSNNTSDIESTITLTNTINNRDKSAISSVPTVFSTSALSIQPTFNLSSHTLVSRLFSLIPATVAVPAIVATVTPNTVVIVVIGQARIDLRAFIAEMIFYLIALAVAFYIAYLLEIVNRRAFLDHRKCVESKFRLTFEKDEQERLLASCLPKHLMKKVRDDIRSRLTLKLLQATQTVAAAAASISAHRHYHHHHQHHHQHHQHHHHHHHNHDHNNNHNHCCIHTEDGLTSLNRQHINNVDVNNNNKQNIINNSTYNHNSHHDESAHTNNVHNHYDHYQHQHHHFQQNNENDHRALQDMQCYDVQKHGSQGSILRPFKELYIDKHENVTILYADIVNSMLLTTALRSPKALVETLNLLFGRFDEAADRHNCLRIKILGDCYYCISGIPEYDPRHAENCIEMALDMIDIIKTFRTETGINLDMRIGVHSGTVLSGLIGLKKWQFDIWSLDAMKAAKMESTGVPGQVHCSSKTLSLVSENVCKHLNIVENCFTNETTYFIERKIPTFCDETSTTFQQQQNQNCYKIIENNSTSELLLSIDELELLKLNETVLSNQTATTCRINMNQIESQEDDTIFCNNPISSTRSITSAVHVQNQNRRRTIMEVISSLTAYSNMIRYSNDSMAATIDSMPLNLGKQYHPTPDTEIHPIFLYFLRRSSSYCERRCSEELAQIPSSKPNTLNGFRRKLFDSFCVDWGQEKMFLSQTDHLYPYYLAASFAISISILVIRYLTLFDTLDSSRFWFEYSNITVYMSSLVALFGLLCCYVSSSTIKRYSIRILFWTFICGSLISSTVLDMQRCWIAMDLASESNIEHKVCLVKWSRYYTYCCVLALCAISLFIRINLWLKFTMSTLGIVSLAITNRYSHCSVFDHVDAQLQSSSDNQGSSISNALAFSHFQYLFLVYLMFHVLDRQIEYLSRLDYLWSTKLKIERARAKLIREVNQLLLKNILPIHVANRFLANPEQTRELYYETYTSCAVMFAAMPNFFKFYAETPETEHGLQYISLLNDIICEFDKLLLSSHFKHRIEKIKTIGSTYMAAAGLHPGRASIDNNVVTVQKETQNLIHLIRFAMSMIKTLYKLNTMTHIREMTEQKKKSANFKLRIGISSGPVIAGVVGALKPQYDIWGDTVNVASRMDTSGVANKIHFPENVAQMLLKNTDFQPQSRGIQDIKGKGEIETFLLDYDPNECPD